LKSKHEHLNEVAKECMEALEKIGIPYGNIVEFTVNTRAKRRWGQCVKKFDGYHINITTRLCDGEHDEGLKNTIIHELLHTCPESMDHGKEWRRWSRIVNDRIGICIQPTNTSTEKGLQ